MNGRNIAWTFFRFRNRFELNPFFKCAEVLCPCSLTCSINLTNLSFSQKTLFFLELFSFLLRTNIFHCSVCDMEDYSSFCTYWSLTCLDCVDLFPWDPINGPDKLQFRWLFLRFHVHRLVQLRYAMVLWRVTCWVPIF